MKIYDFVLGERLSGNYIRNKYTKRFELEDSQITSLYHITKVIYDQLVMAWKDIQVLPYSIDTIMSSLKMLIANLAEGAAPENDSHYRRLREILSTLSFLGYEIYLIQRIDLKTTEYNPTTRAYLIDQNDNLFPTLNRVSSGYGLTFDIPQEASLPNVIMTFLSSIISLEEVTKELINFEATKDKFDALSKVNAGWQFDIENLQRFLSDYGYKFIIVTNY